MSHDFDIVICGGGMVGAALAALLLQERRLNDLNIALIESRFPSQAPAADEVDLRVSAISRASERVLRHCGAWAHLDAQQCSPYADMVVWDAASKPTTGDALHFSAATLGEANLGYIIANNRLQWALLEAALHERVTRLHAQLRDIILEPTAARVLLEDGRQLKARLVLAADGAQSLSRQRVGIESSVRAYRQTAIVTHVQTEKPHRQTAWQRFLPDGPIAFLPLIDGRSSIVWTTTPEQADLLLKMSAAEFAVEIENAADHVLGAVTLAGPRAAFPLQIAQAKEYCRPGFALVGDAAHSIHPLAGQGVNLGFMDAAALVQTLAEACASSSSPAVLGELRVLRRYERWRKSENSLALGLVDGLNRLFSNSNTAAGALRRTGFKVLEHTAPLKRLLMLRALGLAGESPRIVQEAR